MLKYEGKLASSAGNSNGKNPAKFQANCDVLNAFWFWPSIIIESMELDGVIPHIPLLPLLAISNPLLSPRT